MQIPCPVKENANQKREEFWKSIAWDASVTCTKYKHNKRVDDRKPFRFNKASWGTCVSVEDWFWESKSPVNNRVYPKPSKFIINSAYFLFL